MGPLPRLFLHYFDLHFLDSAARNTNPDQLRNELRLATRIAILACSEVIIPAASYFESPLCAAVIDELEPLFGSGALKLAGGDGSVHDFLEAKLGTYDEGGRQSLAYLSAMETDAPFPPYRQRLRSATDDIVSAWTDRAEAPDFLTRQFGDHASLLAGDFLDKWSGLPATLGARAFTPEYAAGALAGDLMSSAIRSIVHNVINAAYFRSYADDFGAGFVTDLVLLASEHDMDNRYGNVRYRQAGMNLKNAGLLDAVLAASPQELLDLKHDDRVALALVGCIGLTSLTEHAASAAKLELFTDLSAEITALRATKTGAQSATQYQRRVAAILDQVFSHSLGTGELEQPIHEGRKRIDVKWLNHSVTGFFLWLGLYYTSPTVLGECKNYSKDLNNPEIDQLVGRFAPQRNQFGFLLCRGLKNRPLMIKRCRDTFQDRRGLVMVLEDSDIEELATMPHTDGWDHPQADFLYRRVREVTE